MIDIKDKKDCVGCNGCVQCCPVSCITMHTDDQGFFYPKADPDTCIQCGLCNRVCPVENQDQPRQADNFFAAVNPDSAVVENSSSGGIFFALASKIISEGGVVFGARFDGQWNVEHAYAETIDDAKAFMGSKYVQSRMGDNFIKVREFLKAGRRVLFSGTPCQIAGLRLFLRKDYGRQLILVDVACHGVPSPMVWTDYLKSVVDKMSSESGSKSEVNSQIAFISFRDKRVAWDRYGLSIRFKSGKDLFEPLSDNLFLRGFVKDFYLRPACYACPAKAGKSGSNLTLADFWGLKQLNPALYSKHGVSLVLAYDALGRQCLEECGVKLSEASAEKALMCNKSLIQSTSMPARYDAFWKRYQLIGLPAVKEFLPSASQVFIQNLGAKFRALKRRLLR